MEDIEIKMKIREIVRVFITQNYWENHEATPIFTEVSFPEMFVIVSKKEDAYNKIVDPVIDGLKDETVINKLGSDAKGFSLALNVVQVDASTGIEGFKRTIANNRPEPSKLNLFIIENFNEMIYPGCDGEEFENILSGVMGIFHGFPPFKNAHVIIITEKTPSKCLSFFERRGNIKYIEL